MVNQVIYISHSNDIFANFFNLINIFCSIMILMPFTVIVGQQIDLVMEQLKYVTKIYLQILSLI